MDKKRGILVVDHGSRSKEAVNEFNHVVEMMKKNFPGLLLLGGHMEINDPDIPSAIDIFINNGIWDITVVPYFLFQGNHSKIDIPHILSEKKKLHPDLKLNYSLPFGAHPLVVTLLSERANNESLIEI
jgi:sirohydrochlorin cobaltochelatase